MDELKELELLRIKDDMKQCRKIMQNSITASNNLLESEMDQSCRDRVKAVIEAKQHMLTLYDIWLIKECS